MIFTEEDVLSFFVDKPGALEDYIVDEAVLFVATLLEESMFVSQLDAYVLRWVRRCPNFP